MVDRIIDLLPGLADAFLSLNPDIKRLLEVLYVLPRHASLVAYLNNGDHDARGREVGGMNGKRPKLVISLDEVPGYFVAMPDYDRDGNYYQANIYYRFPNLNGYLEHIPARWVAKHIDGSAPPRIHGTIPSSVLRAPFHHIPSEFTR